ncbi:hypothetical protein B0H13DRAFT_1856337 [Mycena leptocephala]|nr:hypothetical protein B0H13DRAFT_1856337 [Mycena leptocephala]
MVTTDAIRKYPRDRLRRKKFILYSVRREFEDAICLPTLCFPATVTHSATDPEDNSDDAARDQPSISTLAGLGIKVRDFFYESTLPPIVPFRTLRGPVRGTHPNKPQPLKRSTEEVDHGYGFVMGVPRVRPEKRRRTATGPALSEACGRDVGSGAALPNLDEEAALHAAVWDIFGGVDSEESHSYSRSHALLETPIVTPNASLQWFGDARMPPLVPTEPASAQMSTALVPLLGLDGSSPLSSPPRPARVVLSPSSEFNSQPSPGTDNGSRHHNVPTSTPRYHLPKRKTPGSQ